MEELISVECTNCRQMSLASQGLYCMEYGEYVENETAKNCASFVSVYVRPAGDGER